MSFLAPLFLLGGLAIALPVVFHLIRRTTRERRTFSSLLFLRPTPPRLSRRSRLEHLLLLLLRCAVLCLLAVGFARPLIQKPPAQIPPGTTGRRMLLLVDSSASMRRPNLWSDARTKVESLLRDVSPIDQVALYTFDRQIHPLISFEQWNTTAVGERASSAARRLAESSPDWSSTHLGNALTAAAEDITDANGKAGGGRIVLITDLQEGSHLDALQGYEWPRGLELSVEVLKPRRPGNAGLELINDSEETGSQAGASVRLRVSNSADSRHEQFKVGWTQPEGRGFSGESSSVYVPPGQSRILRLPLPANDNNANRVLLQGDEADFDNSVFVLPPATVWRKVLYFGNDAEQDPRRPLYFLRRAFQETRRQAVQVQSQATGAPLEPGVLQEAVLYVLTETLSESNATAVRGEIAAGKTALCLLNSRPAAASLARLLQLDRLDLEEVRPSNYAMLGEIDFRHPLFAPFADPRFSDFTKIHFWKYCRLNPAALPGARTVAKFDSGDPAIVEAPVGKGRVMVMTSGWQPDESQLALSTKFVPLLYSLLEACSGAAPVPAPFHVGEAVPLNSAPGAANSSVVVRAPDGSELKLSAGETNFTRTTMPGIYTVLAEPPRRFAVNLDPAESRTTPLPLDELDRLGAPVAHRVPLALSETERKIQWQQSELENHQKLWRWFILSALAILLLETWLGGRTSRVLVATSISSPNT